MRLRFEGQTHAIDANTLINVLIHCQTIVSETSKLYGGGAYNVRIQVNAIEKGSFIIDISVIQDAIRHLFSKESVSYIGGVVGIVNGVYSLYKKFKGRPIKTDDIKDAEAAVQMQINGDVNITINDITRVYNTPIVREAISKAVETADEDPNVEGFTISKDKDDDNPVTFERKDFKDYIYIQILIVKMTFLMKGL